MDPVTLLVSALAAGAVQGTGDTVKDATKEAYTKLVTAVRTRLRGRPTAEVVLAEHAKDPATYEKPLGKELGQTGLADDPRVIALAQALLSQLDAAGSAAGKYQVTLTEAQGVQVGDGNTQHVTSTTAAGPRSIAAHNLYGGASTGDDGPRRRPPS